MRKARTANDIRKHPFVESMHTEIDGCFSWDGCSYWVYLKAGYISPNNECGSIHEPTIKDCCRELNNARRATVEEIECLGYPLAEAQDNWRNENE